MDLSSILEFATGTFYLAGRATLGYFQTGVQAHFKEDDTPVIIADRLAEDFIRRRIERAFPSTTIIGDEYGLQAGEEGDIWLRREAILVTGKGMLLSMPGKLWQLRKSCSLRLYLCFWNEPSFAFDLSQC